MFFKNIDLISPNLTLFFKGYLSHSNIFSGILTILIYLISIFSIIYFSLDIICRLNPTVYFYNKTIIDSGNFLLNSDSIFHYVSILGINFEEKNIKVIGIKNTLINLYINEPNSFLYDHYIYEPCTEDNENWEKENMQSMNLTLIKSHNGLCINKFYNATSKKIIYYNDKEFVYPNLKYGTNNEKNIWYGIFIQACQNDSNINNNYCNSIENIKNFINLNSLTSYISFINSEVEIDNYQNPINYIPYAISTTLKNNEFFANHINIQPLKIHTQKGYLFDKFVEQNSYRFESLEKQTFSTSTPIFASYYFWLQSNLFIYERNYKKVQNIMAEIGGLINACLVLGKIINFVVNKYIVILDFEQLLFSIHKKIKDTNLNFNNVINLYNEINQNGKIIEKIDLNKDSIDNSNQNLFNVILNQNSNKNSPVLNNYITHIRNKNNLIKSQTLDDNKEKKIIKKKEKLFNLRKSLKRKKLLFLDNKQSIIFFDYLKYYFCKLNKNKLEDSSKISIMNVKDKYIYNIENLYKKLISEESFVILTYELEGIKHFLNKFNVNCK